MKQKLLLIALAMFSLSLSSCKKDDDDNPAPAAAPKKTYFISFKLDGTDTYISRENMTQNASMGGAASTTAGFFDFTTNVHISFYMPKDSIIGSDLDSLEGHPLPIGNCWGCNNITSQLTYHIGGDDYDTDETINTFPAHYIKINSSEFTSKVDLLGNIWKNYYVTGEFNVKINYGQDVKTLSDGKFALLFRDAISD